MESPKASSGPPNPLLCISTFIHQHCFRLGTELATRLEDTGRILAANWPVPATVQRRSRQPVHSLFSLPFASVSQHQREGKHAFDVALSLDLVANTLAGTVVYTVSNSNNEFVLMSDPNGVKSIGLLCFRQEDAEAFLAQVKSRKGGFRGSARVVPISLDQVYLLKVEGIAFRFMPDPVQIKNAIELKSSDSRSGFDGVPVFQFGMPDCLAHTDGYSILSSTVTVLPPSFVSDLLVVKKKNKRYCPIYFRKEDIERELSTVSRASRGPGVSQHIMVGSLEDVLRKMEMNEKNSGWEDLIFIPPGKSHSQHIQEITKA